MIQLGDLIVILDLHRQGLSISAIARRTGRAPKTIRKYIARGLEPPAYGPRQAGRPIKLAPYLDYLRERIAAFPDLSAVRLTRELRERGYSGAYTAVKRFAAVIRPDNAPKPFEVRFETPAGKQAQVDFARFVTIFTDEPGVTRIIWLFSMVLGHSRFIFARFVMHQDLQTLLRCHMQAFAAIGGVPIGILYDRMKTAVTGEDGDGHIVYNRSLLALAQHYGFHPRACRPSATSGRTSSSRAASAISMISTASAMTGSRPPPTCACAAPRRKSSLRHLPPRGPSCRRCRQVRSTRCSSSSGVSAPTGSCRSAATFSASGA